MPGKFLQLLMTCDPSMSKAAAKDYYTPHKAHSPRSTPPWASLTQGPGAKPHYAVEDASHGLPEGS